MSYATGQTIAAADYNGLAQTTVGGNVAFVLGTGSGQYGYGQDTTAIATVSSTATITATQWAGLVYLINRCLGHQSGVAGQLATGSNIGIVSGATIAAYANVVTAATSIFTNAALFNGTQGTVITGTSLVTYANAAAGAAFTGYVCTRTVTFASADQARYFFNAGGQINLVLSATQPVASTRTADVATLMGTNIGSLTAFRNTTNGGRSGTGGTLTATFTGGYRNLTTAYQIPISIASTTATYTTDVANVVVKTNGVQGVNGDVGTIITFAVGLTAPAHSAFNGTLNVGINHRIDIIPPESTYLTNSWGTPTVA